jgi:DNA-binding transcriptional ArsR family regulator
MLGTADAVVALGALAQETRLAIYRLLVRYAPEGRTPGAIAEALDLAPATLSFHLKELSNAGLVTQQRDGRNLWYRADIGAMNALLGFLTEHCCHGDGRLAACAPACADGACAPKPARNR